MPDLKVAPTFLLLGCWLYSGTGEVSLQIEVCNINQKIFPQHEKKVDELFCNRPATIQPRWIKFYESHFGACVNALAFCNDQLLVGLVDGRVFEIDTRSNEPKMIFRIPFAMGKITAVGDLVVAGCDTQSIIWSRKTRKQRQLPGNNPQFDAVNNLLLTTEISTEAEPVERAFDLNDFKPIPRVYSTDELKTKKDDDKQMFVLEQKVRYEGNKLIGPTTEIVDASGKSLFLLRDDSSYINRRNRVSKDRNYLALPNFHGIDIYNYGSTTRANKILIDNQTQFCFSSLDDEIILIAEFDGKGMSQIALRNVLNSRIESVIDTCKGEPTAVCMHRDIVSFGTLDGKVICWRKAKENAQRNPK